MSKEPSLTLKPRKSVKNDPWQTEMATIRRVRNRKAQTMALRTVVYYIFHSPFILLAFLRRYIDSGLDKILLKQGKKVEATITSCICTDDTTDDEHNIFTIEFEYFINNRKVKKRTNFSINTAHIEYAHLGELFDVPRLEYSLVDFKKSLEPGNKIDIITLGKWPFHYVNQFNPICREVMSIPQVWS
jgi:hypothetical protein